MTKAFDTDRFRDDASTEAHADIKIIPRIAVQAFCETPGVAKVIEQAAADRRMAKTHTKVHMGGLAAAVEFYGSAPTPNLILVESKDGGREMLSLLDRLSDVCDAGTKVVVIGHVNDVLLYRDLIKRGVGEYMVAPFDLYDVLRTIGELFYAPERGPVGRTIAFIGARGGVGSSTIAHNVAWSISKLLESDVVLADLDLAFGTAGLDFNQDPAQGIAEALSQPDRVDDVFLDRILAKCSEKLSLLAAPSTLERTYDLDEASVEPIMDTMRQSVPTVVIDVPHQWTGWVKRTLRAADTVVITASPDLASLRNTKNLIDFLKQARPNDRPPHLVLNQVNVPKRPEIKAIDFAKALEVDPLSVIPFDPYLFGTAANNGQMIAETDPKSATGEIFRTMAQVVTGRAEAKKQKKSSFAPLLAKLRGTAKAG